MVSPFNRSWVIELCKDVLMSLSMLIDLSHLQFVTGSVAIARDRHVHIFPIQFKMDGESAIAPKKAKAKVQAMEKWNESFHYAMEIVNQIPFVFHYVTTYFDWTTAFSDASFQLAAYADDGFRLGLNVSELFKPEHAEALTFLMHSRRHVWPLHPDVKKKREQQVVVNSTASFWGQ